MAIDLAQPMPVAGGWGALGAAMFCTLGLALAAGSVAYAANDQLMRRVLRADV